MKSHRKSEAEGSAVKDFRKVLRSLRLEVQEVSAYSLAKDGFYKVALRGAFVKAFEFADLSWRIKGKRGDETPFFMASTLRGICEDVIALKFLRKLSRPERDETIKILMALQVRKAATEQSLFFSKARPFQPVLTPPPTTAEEALENQRLDEIGATSRLWKTKKGKMPSIETMAIAVGLRTLYDYFYRVASATVHFNPRMIFRSGWGTEEKGMVGRLTPKNYSLYYWEFNRVYSIYLLALFCKTFRTDLKLSKGFWLRLKSLSEKIDSVPRWPEAVTFEEMNLRSPGIIERAILMVMHDEKRRKKIYARRKQGTTP